MEKLNFSNQYILENKVVRLHPLMEDDIDVLLPFSMNESSLWQYSLLSGAGKKNMINYIRLALKDRENEKSYAFTVFDKRIGKFAGSTRFYDYQEDQNTIQLGYTWYGKEFQGSGLNKNTKYLMLNFAFANCGFDRVEFRADNTNARSIAAMKSIGCTVEGILRSNCKSPDGRRDSIILSILKDEWESSIQSMLLEKCQ